MKQGVKEVTCEKLICTNCGKEFEICMPTDNTKVSRIIRTQKAEELCDKCFAVWYKQNGGELA